MVNTKKNSDKTAKKNILNRILNWILVLYPILLFITCFAMEYIQPHLPIFSKINNFLSFAYRNVVNWWVFGFICVCLFIKIFNHLPKREMFSYITNIFKFKTIIKTFKKHYPFIVSMLILFPVFIVVYQDYSYTCTLTVGYYLTQKINAETTFVRQILIAVISLYFIYSTLYFYSIKYKKLRCITIITLILSTAWVGYFIQQGPKEKKESIEICTTPPVGDAKPIIYL